MGKPMKWERIPEVREDEAGHEGIQSGRYRIITGALTREEKEAGMVCSLLRNGKWVKDFTSQRAAKAWAEQMEAVAGAVS